jgi:hypothetical protein
MPPDPISFDLPAWQQSLALEHPGRPEWFERLFGWDGDGFFLPGPVRFWERSTEFCGRN